MNERELDRIAVARGIQPDPQHPFAGLLSEARRLTHAEAGTVYLRVGNQLRPAFVQNDVLARRLGAAEVDRRLKADPLSLSESSIASYVALTGATVNVPDAYTIPSSRPYQLDRRVDAKTGYRTRSMLALPIRDPRGTVGGVLELINALNVVGGVISFEREKESAVATLLAAAASIEPT